MLAGIVASPSVELRTAVAGDEDFLYRLYASTRADELALLPWEDRAKEAFLQMQFAAQDRAYRAAFPVACSDIIVVGSRPAGRLLVNRAADELRVVDIALLPEHRSRGIGTALIRALLAQAADAGTPVRLNVLRRSPARRLYKRLGFRETGDDGVYTALEWTPLTLEPRQPTDTSDNGPVYQLLRWTPECDTGVNTVS